MTATAVTRSSTAHTSRDARRESLEQLVALGAHDPADRLRDRGVVDGVVERVGVARGLEVDGELDVDLERLRARLLLGEHAVHPELAQPRDRRSCPSLAPSSARGAAVGGLADDLLVDRDRDDLTRRPTPSWRPVIFSIDDHRVRALGDEPGVEQVPGEHTEQPVAELLVVDQARARSGSSASVGEQRRRARAAARATRRGARAGRARTGCPPLRTRAGCAASRGSRACA